MNETPHTSSAPGPKVGAGTALQQSRGIVKIPDQVVVHLRTVMLFAEAASKFSSEVRVAVGEQSVNGKDVMELLVLLGPGHRELEICAEGSDAHAALKELQRLVARDLFEG